MKQLYIFLLLWIPFFALSNDNARSTPVNLNNGTPPPTVIKYVKVNGTGDGSSWATAMGDLQAAINETGVNEVWVAAGEYQPGLDQSFRMVEGVEIYGGFPASGDPGMTDRDWEANTTTLKGNDNSVIRNSGAEDDPNNLTKAAVLDGFIITGGKAVYGGGIYNSFSSPTLTNLEISENEATKDGGGMYNYDEYSLSPTLTNVTISGNTAVSNGGGVHNYSNGSSFTLTNVTISGNTAGSNGGGVYHVSYESFFTLTNVTISGNKAKGGGEWYSNQDNYTIPPVIRNSIIYGTGSNRISGMLSNIKNSLIQGRNITADGNIAASAISSVADIFTDPGNAKYSLKAGSPVINAGNNDHYNSELYGDKDIAGNPRIFEGTIDIGAYEFQEIQIFVPDVENILYVDQQVSSGNGIGDSWDNALPNLTDALSWAKNNKDKDLWNESKPLQVWVAAGEYQPGFGQFFEMVEGVEIYGGFPASGDRGRAARDWEANKTVLKGNGNSVIRNSGNNLTKAAVLDGFILTGGKAADGGGMYNTNSSPTLMNVAISENTATTNGGGMYNIGSSSKPTLMNLTISGNKAKDGGGMYNSSSSPTLTNVTISENTATNNGGGMLTNSSSSPTLTNVTISGNTATTNGGGMYTASSSKPILTNVTISGNTATTLGGEWYQNGDAPVIRNSIIYGKGIHGTFANNEYSLIQGVENTDKGNIKASTIGSVADLFTDPGKGDYSLKVRSPAVDAGNNNHYNSVLYGDKDIADNPRILGSAIDMGAYESPEIQIGSDAENILYVDQQVFLGNGTGNSWENAIPELADALKWAREKEDAGEGWTESAPLKIYVAKGVYKPLYNAADGLYSTAGEDNRDNAFVMVKNVRLYGGFDPETGIEELNEENDRRILPKSPHVIPSGTEESPAKGTILSGDIGVIDVNADNAYHVLISADDVKEALLDGFTISEGNANGSYDNIIVNGQDVQRAYGGGMYNHSSSPTLRNVEISGNKSDLAAGGMVNEVSSPSLTNVTIRGNTAGEGECGGIYNYESSPTLTNVEISGNSAQFGGGMVNYFSSPTLTNVTISGNEAVIGGGMFNYESSPTLTNVTISGNTAESGGVMYNEEGSTPKIRNSIVFGNNSGIVNNEGSSTDIKHSLVQGEAGGSDGNLDGTDDAYTSEKIFESPIDSGLSSGGNYRLKSTSPLINKGSDEYYGPSEVPDLSGITTDLDGNNRFNDVVDMGAYERQMKQQEFVFSDLVEDKIIATYGDAGLSPAKAIGVVVYTVPADNGVVEVIDGKIHILSAGDVEVTFNAAGNSEYDPAVELTKVLKVGKRELTATALEVSKVYDGTTTVATETLTFEAFDAESGLIGTDEVSVVYTSASYDTKEVGTDKEITIVGMELAGEAKDNYSLMDTTATITGTITAKEITLSLNALPAITKVYDKSDTATLVAENFTLSGLETDDIVTVSGTATYDDANVGDGKTITVEDLILAGDDNANYSLTTTTASTAGDITAKDITLTLNGSPAITKVYDKSDAATLVAGNYTLSGLETDDIVTVSGTATYDNANVGDGKTITVEDFILAGADKDNYSLTTTTASTTGDITAKDITLTLNALPLIEKVYDKSDVATLVAGNFTLSGLETDDIVTVSGTATYDDANVGDGKTITVEDFILAGDDNANYSLTTTTASTTGDITAKEITLTLNALPTITKIYDKSDEAILVAENYVLSGLEIDDVVTVSGMATYDNVNVGIDKIITVTDFLLDGTDKDNYSLTTNFANTTGDITQKHVIVTAKNKNKVYGEDNPGFTLAYDGLVNGETEIEDLTVSTSADKTSPVDDYSIKASGTSSNYTISFVEGKLAITLKSVTVTAEDKSKVYGEDNPGFTLSYDGLVNGETEIEDLTVSTSADKTSPVDVYSIKASGTSSNYTISFVSGELTITPKSVTVTAENKGKVYGEDNPEFTLSYDGLVNGETEIEDLTVSTSADKTSPVDVYSIKASGTSSNYTISFVEGELRVIPKSVTITAIDKNKVYGQSDPALTYTLSSALVGSDAFTGVLSRMSGEDVGAYAIGQGTLALNNNYGLTFVPGSLRILESEMVGISFEGKTVVYNGTSHLLEVRGLPGNARVVYGNNGQIDAGTYTVTATISQPNHGDLVLTAVLTIQKAQALITAEARQEYGYDGTTKNIMAKLDHGETNLTYSPQQGYTSAGTYNITIGAAETGNYLAASKPVTLIIRQGQPVDRPVLEDRTVTYDGKTYSLEAKSFPTGAKVTYENNEQVNAGTYEVTAKITHPDYEEELLTAKLTIRKAGQRIQFKEVGKLLREVGHVALEVSSDSGLPVRLHSSDELVGTIAAKSLLVHRLGTTRITATQEGDGNYEVAEPVTITVLVEDGIEEGSLHVHRAFSPNGDGINDFLIVEGIRDFPENRLQVLTLNQLVVFEMEGYDNDGRAFRGISNTTGSGGLLPEGTYFYVVRYNTSNGWKTKKGWFVLKVRY